MQLRTNLRLFVLVVSSAACALAQNPAPQTPAAPTPASPPSGVFTVPSAAPAQVTPFPPVDPANFMATTPTKQTVEDFLHAFWGYDSTRLWQIQAIMPTPAPGVSRVLVLVKSTNPGPKDQTAQLSFFTLPDGKFLVADSLLPFGSKPFEGYRQILQTDATGPSKGGASKAIELVEFLILSVPTARTHSPSSPSCWPTTPALTSSIRTFPCPRSTPRRSRRRPMAIASPKPAATMPSSSSPMRCLSRRRGSRPPLQTRL